MESKHSVLKHFKRTFASMGDMFTGGAARISMKTMATGLNLYVPPEYRESNPFGCAFAVGFGFAPILNIPRVFQLQKVGGDPYPTTLKDFFLSGSGLMKYGQNTAMFAPGEGLRMMMCFGTKDFLMPRLGGKEDPRELNIPMKSGTMAMIAGPSVAFVETLFALTTETASTIHAKTSSQAAEGVKKSFMTVLKETVTPAYVNRCFLSLSVKNIA